MHFRNDATEQDFLDYLKDKIDWRVGDVLQNVAELNKIARLKKNLIEENIIADLDTKFDDLIKFIADNKLDYNRVTANLNNAKWILDRETKSVREELKRLEEMQKDFAGIVISEFKYTPSKDEKYNDYYGRSQIRKTQAKMEIVCASLASGKSVNTLELTGYYSFTLCHWKRLNRRKKGDTIEAAKKIKEKAAVINDKTTI